MRDLFIDDIIKEFTVTEITVNIKRILESSFQYVKVKGEISNYKKSSAGHVYFSLKDENAIIAVVCFHQVFDNKKFDELEDGLQVAVSGKLSIYKERSNYQIVAENVQADGIGTLLKIIEIRKQKLEKEGLFNQDRKKLIPDFIENVGIITSPYGAAIQDITSKLKDRFPVNILLYPVSVQGESAAKDVIKSVKYFNSLSEDEKPEVIVITRGGGSFDDLLVFSDEQLVRAVADSEIPIISAIGHEIDSVLLDFVADLRVPTPTAAAEAIALPLFQVKKDLTDFSKRVYKILIDKINLNNFMLINVSDKFYSINKILKNVFDTYSYKLKDCFENKMSVKLLDIEKCCINLNENSNKLNNVIQFELDAVVNNLKYKIKELSLFDYKKTLKKGFVLVRNIDGKKIIKSVNKIKKRDKLVLEFYDGKEKAEII